MKTVTKECQQCGVVFTKRDNGSPHKFCSHSCRGKWYLARRVMRGPSLIGNKLRKGFRPTNAFTSEQVRGKNNPNWKEGAEYSCEECCRTFIVKPWIVRQNGRPRFCSRKCFTQSGTFRGEKSTSWVGGPTTYRGKGWIQARLAAVERDGGLCRDCKKEVGKSIPVHHIIPFRLFESAEEANRIENLICLCQSCHMKREKPQRKGACHSQ